jgi:hypothetical protein
LNPIVTGTAHQVVVASQEALLVAAQDPILAIPA